MSDPKKERRDKVSERLGELSTRLLRRELRVEICGTRQLVVEGCRGILEYSEELIKLSTGRQALVIRGSELRIKNLFPGILSVCGRILSVEYC